MTKTFTSRWYVVAVLFLVGVFNFMDRQILAVLLESIKRELNVSDSAMGLLTGFAFVSFYTLASLPIARAADSYCRKNIVALGLAFWSAMTALSGFVGSFIQLAGARIGVGIGEAAAAPAGHSMISDLFGTERRSVALSVLAVSTPVGLMTAFVVGGWLNNALGWRLTLVAIGLPGTILALIVFLTIGEPRRGGAEHDNADHLKYDVVATLSYLWQSRSLRSLTLGTSLGAFAGWAVLVWSPSFLLRIHNMPTHISGPWLGLATGVCGATSTLLAGIFTERLARRDTRWLMLVPALTNLFGAPFVVLFLTMPEAGAAVPMFFGIVFFGPAMIGPVSAVIQSVAKIRMRAFAAALISMIFNLIGVGLGPLAVGIISDLLSLRFGDHSIRYALAVAALAHLGAALAFWLGATSLETDLQRARGDG